MSLRTNSRREFLKGSATLAAGATLLSGLNIARTAHASGSDALKVALVGCGGRGTGAIIEMLTAAKLLGNKSRW